MLEEFAAQSEGPMAELVDLASKGEVFAPGRPMKHEVGINYVGPWETKNDGVAIAVRRHARALRKTGIPVFLRSDNYLCADDGAPCLVEYSALSPVVLAEVGHMTEPTHAGGVLLVRHCVPTDLNVASLAFPPRAIEFLDEASLERYRRSTVLFAAFEADAFSPEIVQYLGLLGQVWVTCDKNMEALAREGLDPARLRVIPHPFYKGDPMAKLPPRKPRAGRPFRFLNVSKWEPRKGQHALIGGFLRAFQPVDPVELILKINPFVPCKHYPEGPEESIASWIENEEVRSRGWNEHNVRLKVRIFFKLKLTREDLSRFYAESDAYVSAGRAEGFDLPAFDAKLAGLKLLYAHSGGPEMFATGTDIELCSEKKREPFHPMYGACERATWSAFDAADVARAMTRAIDLEDSEQEEFDRSRYTLSAVGTTMREACNALAKENGTDISEINVDKKETA